VPPTPPTLRSEPVSEPIGLLSDVHGNLEALEAVLAELGRRAVVKLYVAGDLLLDGAEPLAVWQRLQQVGAKCVCGPSDVALSRVDARKVQPSGAEESAKLQRFVATQKALGELVIKRLGQLPKTLRVPMMDGRELLVVHGSPRDPFETIGHELDEDEMLAMLDDDPADVIVCGGTHVPWNRMVGDAQVINVGSVGASPEGRVAHYTVLQPRMDGVDFEQCWVEY
jgi:predicted phosphodiesterase